MPELPEVETVRRGLQKLTLGQTIIGQEVLLKRTLAYPDSVAEFEQGIRGLTITNWQRRGKYLLAELSNQSWLGIHLRMTGQLLWLKQSEPLQKHTRLRLFLQNNQELRFVDTRTFGKVWWIPATKKPEQIMTGLQDLGVEPLGNSFTVAYFLSKLQQSQRPIKNILLDQTIIAGIGNIYADESLFKSKILPDTPAAKLNLEQIEKLRLAIIEVLQTAIQEGGTSFSDFINLLGVNGNYGGVAWVYRRTGQPCRVCHSPIAKLKLGGRSTHFCPHCQQ